MNVFLSTLSVTIIAEIASRITTGKISVFLGNVATGFMGATICAMTWAFMEVASR